MVKGITLRTLFVGLMAFATTAVWANPGDVLLEGSTIRPAFQAMITTFRRNLSWMPTMFMN